MIAGQPQEVAAGWGVPVLLEAPAHELSPRSSVRHVKLKSAARLWADRTCTSRTRRPHGGPRLIDKS